MAEDNRSTAPVPLYVSPEDFGVVASALAAIAQQCQHNNRMREAGVLKNFVVRLKQSVYGGEGVPDDLLQRLTAKIEHAFGSGDWSAAQDALGALIAAAVRMDPNAGAVVATQVAPTLVKLTYAAAIENQRKIAAETLRAVLARLVAERAAFHDDGWKASAADTFDYVRNLVDFMASELDAGLDPFADAAASGDPSKPSDDSN